MRYHADDRGQRYCDIFPQIGKGDINITIVEPGAAALWHRHEFQTDYQIVVKGALKIGVANLPRSKYKYYATANPPHGADVIMSDLYKDWEEKYYSVYTDSVQKYSKMDVKQSKNFEKDVPRCDWHYLSERNANQGALFIPSGLWHGCYNYTNEPAILCYHITNKWDGTDEERCTPEILDYNYEREVK